MLSPGTTCQAPGPLSKSSDKASSQNMTSRGPTHKQTALKGRREHNCGRDSGPTPGPLVERS